MTVYLSSEQLLELHTMMIKRYGGSQGVRDWGLVESALARPAASFSGQDAYPDIFTKAAVLLHSLVTNHGFVDGNKRTAIAATGAFLLMNGYEIDASQKELVTLTLKVAEDKLDEEAIADWLKEYSQPI